MQAIISLANPSSATQIEAMLIEALVSVKLAKVSIVCIHFFKKNEDPLWIFFIKKK